MGQEKNPAENSRTNLEVNCGMYPLIVNKIPQSEIPTQFPVTGQQFN
jgi:hypothetical protein